MSTSAAEEPTRRRIPPIAAPPRAAQVRNPLSLNRVNRAIARSAAGFGIAFLLQSVGPMIEQLPNMNPVWSWAIVGGLVASLAFAVVASVMDRLVRSASTSFAAIYLIALISWPFAVLDPSKAPMQASYWLYFLLTIATAMATVGLDIRWATIFVVVVPVIYAVIRLTPPGGGVSIVQAILDSVYAIILGGAITIITTILRNASTAVDRAQQTALERYSHAVRQHATEAERVQVDAIVHDSVLTTLLSASRAYTPEARSLAATMAGNAIGYLREAVATAPAAGGSVRMAALANRIADAASTMSQPFTVRTHGTESALLPVPVAEALYSATVQAMVNSLQHAGPGVARWAEVNGDAAGGVVVIVGDRGVGFDPASVPHERLGVRVSILERLAGAGGYAEVQSEPGEGTLVTLRWPDERSTTAPEFADFEPAIDGDASELT